nr:hypothetical protein [Candidatus Saccharibacteria bacterium]
EGITRTTVLELARDLGYKTKITPITVEDFLNADEAFFTGTAAEVTPITRVTDSRDTSKSKEEWKTYQLGNGKPGKISLQLAQLYGEVVRGQHSQYNDWLDYVYKDAEEAQLALGSAESEEKERITRF